MLKSNDDTHYADPRNSPIASVQPTNTQVILYPTRNNVPTTYTNPKIICKSVNKTEISKIAQVPLPQPFVCQKGSCEHIAIGQRIGNHHLRPCGVGHPRGLKPSVSWLTDTKLFILFPVVPGPLPPSLTIGSCSPGLKLLIETHNGTRPRKGSYFPNSTCSEQEQSHQIALADLRLSWNLIGMYIPGP
jgi:hypothetical protein